MDIALALAEGKRGAIARATEVARYIAYNPAEFNTLLNLLTSNNETVVSHACHALQSLGKLVPDLVKSHSAHICQKLQDNPQWEMVEAFSKLLPIFELSEVDAATAVAVLDTQYKNGKGSLLRTWALQALYDLAENYPQHQAKANDALHIALEKGSKAMQARARKLLSVKR